MDNVFICEIFSHVSLNSHNKHKTFLNRKWHQRVLQNISRLHSGVSSLGALFPISGESTKPKIKQTPATGFATNHITRQIQRNRGNIQSCRVIKTDVEAVRREQTALVSGQSGPSLWR